MDFDKWFIEHGMPIGAAIGYSFEDISRRAWNAASEEVRERCATLCDEISNEYRRREGMEYPELKTDAQIVASECATKIRMDQNQ